MGMAGEKITFQAQAGPQTAFLASSADLTIFGGARGGGKTYGLLLDPLRYVRIPQFRAVIFRRTFPQIHQEGGPWDTSQRIYPYCGASSAASSWTFPSGATISFHHLANPDDWQNWLGAQVPYIGFDQFETFTERQVFSMMASNRDANGIIKPCIRATCNPQPKCWLSRFIQWWWDPATGYPIKERSGVLRWFCRVGDVIKWADRPEKLKELYPGVSPKSVTFIPSFVSDNPALLQSNPGYMGELLAQPLVQQEQWIKGNWKIEATSGTIFNRAWFADKMVKTLPDDIPLLWVRYWDLAHTAEEEGEDPDWTCSVKMARRHNQAYVIGFTRWRRTPLETERSVRATAQADGIEVRQCMEQEPAAGKSLCEYYRREVLAGFTFEPIPSMKHKIIRAGPLSSACQAGNVFLMEGDWNAEFIDHLEAFRGDEEKNDVPDGASGAYNALFSGSQAALLVSVNDRDRGYHPRVATRERKAFW